MAAHERHGRGQKVWLTPPDLVEELGPFDLDPCFGPPRPWATARAHYGPDDALGGGLSLPWYGMVWCNPPYDQHWEQWLARCSAHADAIALIFARTETAAFHRQVWNKADALFFFEGRLHFHFPDGRRAPNNSGAPSVLVAYGPKARWRLSGLRRKGAFIDLRVQMDR